MGGRREDPAIVVGELEPHDAPVGAGLNPTTLPVADFLALAGQAVGRRRAAVFEGVAVGLEALEGQVALLTGNRTDAVQGATFGMDKGIDPVREQGSGDRSLGSVMSMANNFDPLSANKIDPPGATKISARVCASVDSSLLPA